jgi:hypothetical protein
VTDEAGVLYLAQGLSHGTSQPEPTEQIEVRWVPFDEALAMAGDGRISDAMTLIGLLRVALERLGAVGRGPGRVTSSAPRHER